MKKVYLILIGFILFITSSFAQLKVNSSGNVLIDATSYSQPSEGGIVHPEGATSNTDTTATVYIAGKSLLHSEGKISF